MVYQRLQSLPFFEIMGRASAQPPVRRCGYQIPSYRNGLQFLFQFFENVKQALVSHFLFDTKFIQTFIFVKPSVIQSVPQNCSTGSTKC